MNLSPRNNRSIRANRRNAKYNMQDGHFVKRNTLTGNFLSDHTLQSRTIEVVYIGPSVEGDDVEYIARVNGIVSKGKPSYAR